MNPLRFLAVVFITVALFLVVTSQGYRLFEPSPSVGVVVPTPEEDEPGFDCRIHGNKVCGPQGPVHIPE
jgi:hypothetical protein